MHHNVNLVLAHLVVRVYFEESLACFDTHSISSSSDDPVVPIIYSVRVNDEVLEGLDGALR